MSELDNDVLRIGTWVVETAINLWFDDLVKPVSHSMDLLKAKVQSLIRQRRLAREFEQIVDTVAEWLLHEAAGQAGLPEEVFRRQVSDGRRALFAVSRGHDNLLRKWHDPTLLASLIRGEAGISAADGAIVLASCVALREVLSRMRADGQTRIPENVAEIPDFVRSSLREISADELNPSQDEFGILYHRLVIESIGLSQQLTSLFVHPRVQFRTQGDEGSSLFFDDALTISHHLLLLGEPGSGKTTTLQWLAVRTAQSGLSRQSAEVNLPQPFFVRLRDWSRARPVPVLRLADLVAIPLDLALPSELVQQRLTSGSALLLIDGLDELPKPEHIEVWAWLGQLAAQFPAARMVVTTRPSAVRDLPLIDGFDVADLLPMDSAQIATYVNNWYTLASRDSDDLTRYEHALREAIANSSHVARLASSPLMCSLLCMLTLERHAVLPQRQDIYAAFLKLLLDLNESKPHGAGAAHLSRIQSMVLLGQIAYWFLVNEYAEADRNDVLHRIGLELRNMPEIVDSPERVLRSLVESNAVLRESAPGRIDFLHQTLAEYLAARAVVDQGAIGSLIPRAHEELWSEVAILAAGQASETDCVRLLNGLLKRARSEFQHRDRLLDTVRTCIHDRPELQNRSARLALESIAEQRPSEDSDRPQVIVALDIANFAAPYRTSSHQISMRDALYQILQRAFNRTGVSWDLLSVQDRGDGVLVLAPPGAPIGNLLRDLPGEIAAGIQEFNTTRSAEADLRIRMAIHSGIVSTDRRGMFGEAVDTACRLLDSHVIKEALRSSSGILVAILSDTVHQEPDDASTQYRRCVAIVKSTQIEAWVGVFGNEPKTYSHESELDNLLPPTAALRKGINRAQTSLAWREAATPLAVIKEHAAAAVPAKDGLAALRQPGIGVITELSAKRHVDPVWLAQEFERGGARVISLGVDELTRETLITIRAAVHVPLLCNDLVISPYQVYEARSWGADMVLLIVSAMVPRTLAALCDLTEELSMTAVVRVRTTAEADRALEAGARMISIDTTKVDPHRFGLIAGDLPPDVITIGEGAQDVGDVVAFERAAANAVLVSRNLGDGDPQTIVRLMVAVGKHRWSNRSS